MIHYIIILIITFNNYFLRFKCGLKNITFGEDKAGFESGFSVSAHVRIGRKTRLSASDNDGVVVFDGPGAATRIFGRLADVGHTQDLLTFTVGHVERSVDG